MEEIKINPENISELSVKKKRVLHNKNSMIVKNINIDWESLDIDVEETSDKW